jgi:hypothetical protein
VATVADKRSDYAQKFLVPEEWLRANKRAYRKAGTYLVSGPGTLLGATVRRGASDVLVTVYDRSSIEGILPDEEIAAAVGATGAAGATGGFVNLPVLMERGIVVSINQADAVVMIYYV